MKIITDLNEIKLHTDTAVAIGKFDGVHVGHQKLLQRILAYKEQGLAACVFTFDPSPSVFFGLTDGMQLSTPEEKRALFEQMGIDYLVEFPMNAGTAIMEAEEFARDILADSLCAKFLVAGADLSFGAKGAGNVALLQTMSQELGLTVEVIDKVMVDGAVVSSTRVRDCLEAGQMEKVADLCGRPYAFRGVVQRGNQIGRTLGFPTINLAVEDGKLVPSCGVYFSEVVYDGKRYRSISNVGYKPTVGGETTPGVETYIYDFDKEIYGDQVEVRLLRFHRPEQKFDGLEELKAQLAEDIEGGKIYQLSAG